MTFIADKTRDKGTGSPKGLLFTRVGIGLAWLLFVLSVVVVLTGVLRGGPLLFLIAFGLLVSSATLGVLCEISLTLTKSKTVSTEGRD